MIRPRLRAPATNPRGRARRPAPGPGCEPLGIRLLLSGASPSTYAALASSASTSTYAALSNTTAAPAPTLAVAPAATSAGGATSGGVVASSVLPGRLRGTQKFSFGGSGYQVQITGSGGVVARSTRRGVGLTLLGTDSASQVAITLIRPSHLSRTSVLPLSSLSVRTGQLGSFSALSTADLDGPISPLGGTVSSLQFDAIGPAASIDVARDLGTLQVANDVSLGASGRVLIGGDVTGSVSIGGSLRVAGGRFSVARDVGGPIAVGGDLTLVDGGTVSVGRDLSSLAVAGDVSASAGGLLSVGRNASSATVRGDVDTSGGGSVAVGGNLGALTVDGAVRGKLSRDIVVGLALGSLNVLGGIPNQGGLQMVNLDVGKSIDGLDVSHGIYNSVIAAGTQINGGAPRDGYSIGPDGPVAVFDSTITAGVQIANLTVDGDVKSDLPTNPSGMPTRIIAGVDDAGTFNGGGIIDNFQITGNLVDSVVAAGVRPAAGNGSLGLPHAPGDLAHFTYGEPAGTIRGTTTDPVTSLPTAAETFSNDTAPPFADPTPADTASVLGGRINPSFAGTASATNPLPFPIKATVLGRVISTAHAVPSDYAGLFAADTRDVFIGALPG